MTKLRSYLHQHHICLLQTTHYNVYHNDADENDDTTNNNNNNVDTSIENNNDNKNNTALRQMFILFQCNYYDKTKSMSSSTSHLSTTDNMLQYIP